MWFHNYLASRGYCNNAKPKLQIRIRQKGKVFYQYRVNSYTFSSFNWIHEMFYKLVDNKYIKIIPLNIEEYLTPLALAIWFMDDGSSLGKGVRIATNCFTLEEVNFLCNVLKSKYNIIATPNKCGKDKGHIIYIHVNSMKIFTNIVKPYLLPSLYYKLGFYK
jgi:ubiquinol-cytochrome c reductase cytochrome b subunit